MLFCIFKNNGARLCFLGCYLVFSILSFNILINQLVMTYKQKEEETLLVILMARFQMQTRVADEKVLFPGSLRKG